MIDVAQYKRDGFTLLHRVFQPRWNHAGMESMLQRMKSIPTDDYRFEARMFGASANAMFIFGAPRIQEAVRLLGVQEPVFLTNPACHVMGVDDNWDGVGPHQDWPALQTSLNTVVVWIPYTRITKSTYPVEFAKGSHLLGLLPAKPGSHYSEVDAANLDFVPVECEVGDAILFSVFTVHRTRTPGKGFRLAVSHRYEDAADPWFRGRRYSAQRRVFEREVKDAPTVDEIRKAAG